MADKQLRVVIVGDAKSVQKAFADTATSATQAEVKVEGFGKSFAKAGVALGLGAAAVGAVVGVMHEAIGAVGDYNTAIDTATKTLLGQTKSQTETAAALAVARAEADKGRGTYQELAGAMAGLSTVAKTAGLSLSEVTQTAEILAAINPEEGIKGATFALREAASGDMTSVIERFNLSRTTINKLRAEGVPAIEAVRQAMAELGYDTKFLDTANQSSAKQLEIAKGKFTELAAIVGKPFFDVFIQGVTAATKAVDGPGGESFAQRLAKELDLILHVFDGRVFEQLGVDVGKTFFLIGDAFNHLLKSVSGGKLDIDGPLKEFYKSITSAEAEVVAAGKKGVTQPLADELSGKSSSSPLAPAKVQGYGAAVLDSFLAGLTSGQIGDFKQFTAQFQDLFKGADGKADTEAFAQAQSLLAQALKEVAQDGQISETTLFRLTTTFGKSAAEVERLTLEYGRMGAAQEHATATTNGLAAAQANLAGVQAEARNAAADADKAIAAAQATATQHSNDAAAAIDREQDALRGVADAAGEAARASAARIDSLQSDLARANAAVAAIQEQRRKESEGLQAVLAGETAEFLSQLDAQDDLTRKIVEKWDAEIGGQRRAKDAANSQVDKLNVAAHKEDLDFITRIQAAREKGNAKEANALQRQFDAAKKKRAGAMEVAQAQAAVADDEYDAAAKKVKQEQTDADRALARDEKAAQMRATNIQADIKGVQDAAKAEADRYAAQQRGIQAEIDRLGDAAKVQATKDQAAITAAQNLKTETALKWQIEESGAKVALGLGQQIATANERIAKAAKETYDADAARVPFAQAAAQAAQDEAAARAKFAPGNTPLTGPESTGTPESTYVVPGGRKTPPPPRYMATKVRIPPANYHFEVSRDGTLWFIADGWTLADYGDEPYQGDPGTAPTAPGGNGGSDSLGRSGQASLREAGGPLGAPATAGAGGVTINIHAPNLTDLGSTAQQAALGTLLRREFQQQARGGSTPRGA